MEENKWNNKGKLFFIATLVLSLFSIHIIFTSYNNVINNRNWFLELVLLLNCMISIRNSIKLKQRYHFIGSIILVITVLAYILISRFNF